MTNKKFKVAAMSMALTACVAAQPLIANAADDVNAVSNDSPDSAPQSEGESTASAPVAAASVSSDPVTNQQSEGAVDVIGDPDISVDYNHDNDKVTKDDSSTTTESTGPVNRDVPKESEPGAQQPSGDGQQTEGNGQQDGNHETDLNNEQKGEPETDLNNEQKGESKTDLNNEQEGPKDGDNETEKKPIGTAEKSETETKDTELVLSKPTTTTTTTTNPDGSTTTTTTTTTDAALETTTKVEGEASAKTEERLPSEDVKKTLKEELDGALSWDTETDTKFGDYTVTDAVEKDDGTKTFTLTKEDKIETGKMTGLDISKLIEAGYTDNGDGTYTLTKEYTDSQGQKQTTTVKVDSSKATKTTSTTLTVTMEKTPHHDSKDVDESTDTGNSQLENRYPAQSVIKDGNGNILWTGSVAELLKDSPNGEVTCYEEGGKTYTFTFTESSEGPSSSLDFSPEDAAILLGEGYSCSNGKIYHTDGDKLTEVDYDQAIQRINLNILLSVSEEKKEEKETVSNSDQTVAEATETAKKNAAEAALKNALKEAASKAGITDNLDDALNDALKNGEIDTAAPGTWEYTATVDGKEKTFVFAYDKTTVTTQRAEASDAEKNQVKADSGEKIDDITKNTSTGSASVSGAVITWTESGKSAYEVIKNTEFAESPEIDLKNIPTDASKEDLEGGGTRYTYTDAAGKKYELIYTAPTDEQLNQIKAKLLADGMTEENIKKSIENGDFTYVSWKITSPTEKDGTVTEQITDDKANLSSGNVKIEDKGNGNYTITVNGNTYKNMTTNDGGRTYTSVNGNTTTTIRVQTEALSSSQIKDLLTPTYGDTVKVDKDGKATYIRHTVDGKDVEVTINYSDAVQTNADVTIDTTSSATATDHDEDKAYQKLLEEINRLKKEAADRGEELFWNEDNLSKKEITIDYVKQIATAVNFGSLKGQDLINFLEVQKKAAEAANDSYTGKGYWDSWSDGKNKKLRDYNYNTIGHLDLGVDSTLTTLNNKSEDCILVPADDRAEGDTPLEFVWSDSAEALVNNNQSKIKKVGLIERVTLDDEYGRTEGHYEFPRASWDNHQAGWYQDNNGNWHEEKNAYKNPTPDNAPTTSAYYRVTGTVAYGSLKDTTGKMRDFDDKVKAQEEAEKYAKANGIDTSQITVVAVYPDQDRYSTPVYRAYLYKSNMTAYGYMTKEGNTCTNKSFNYTYGMNGKINGLEYIGGYDLLLAKLTQVSKDQITGEQYKSYSYMADLFTRKKDSGSSNALTQKSLEYTHKVPGPDKTEGQGTGYFGNYDVSYEQSFAWDDSGTESSKPRGTGSDSFFSFKKLFNHITRGSTDVSRKQGTITANYATTSDAKVTDASKKTCVKTDSSVKYHYSYVERQELDPITETKTVTTPDDDDGDGGDKIIEEKDHDSPVLPGTPELPPVQDAKPDAPVLPADPALPAVQDAHALPQTGVNWLAAIGLALSGMTLMITGAFASLTGKNAKH